MCLEFSRPLLLSRGFNPLTYIKSDPFQNVNLHETIDLGG
jgi:hypothetical protein